MPENIYQILDWIFCTIAVITILCAIKTLGAATSTGWNEEKETKKSS